MRNAITRRRHVRGFWHEDCGASLVEFAILTPVFLVLLFGVIEVGRYMYYGIVAANAARAGVQYGAQNATTASDATGQATAAYNDGQDIKSLGFVASPSPPFCTCSDGTAVACTQNACPLPSHRNEYVKVTVTGTVNSLFNYSRIPTSSTINAQVTMRVLQEW